jgi:hypothetical protein
MEIRKVLALRGPNRWTLKTALEVWLDERDVAEAARQRECWRSRLAAIAGLLRTTCEDATPPAESGIIPSGGNPSSDSRSSDGVVGGMDLKVPVGVAFEPGQAAFTSFGFEEVTASQPVLLSQLLAQLTLVLQQALGMRVSHRQWLNSHEPLVTLAVVEYEDERLGRACLEFAERFVRAVIQGESLSLIHI